MSKSKMLNQIAIVSFSPIAIDARVLRQIDCLSLHYSVAVIGYGDAPSALNATFYSVVQADGTWMKMRRWFCLLWGKVFPKQAYEYLYWSMPYHQQALDVLLQIRPQIIHANDLEALPVAVRASEILGSKIVLDLHEYAPLEVEQRPEWVALYRPYVEYWLRKYSAKPTASITVADTIAERYAREFGFHPITILNIPMASVNVDFRPVDPACIRLIHHGVAIAGRQLEKMIYALALTDARYQLHFMLVGDEKYQSYLKKIAEKVAPNRVFFHSPVMPMEIVSRIAEYDMGFFLLPPVNYNWLVALPNKFFDFVHAGLALCIGPSPEMARLVRAYDFGIVADSFEPQAISNRLNSLTSDVINDYKKAALKARNSLNANNEMRKLLQLYHMVLSS